MSRNLDMKHPRFRQTQTKPHEWHRSKLQGFSDQVMTEFGVVFVVVVLLCFLFCVCMCMLFI